MRSISLNFIYNLAYKILFIIAPLITTPYISRKLGAGPIGEYSYISTLVAMLVLVGGLGTGLYAQRGIAQRRNNISEKSLFFKELLLIRFIGIFACLALYLPICFLSNNKLLYLICGIELFASLFDITWLYQGEEDFSKILFRNILLKLAVIISIFLLVKSPSDLDLYAAIRALSVLLSNLSIWLFVGYHISLKSSQHPCNIRKHINSIFKLFIPQIATQLYSNSDKLMLKWIRNDNLENGYYDQTYKIIEICLIFATALNATLMPRLSYLYANNMKQEYRQLFFKSIQLAVMFTLPMVIGLYIVADEFVTIFFGRGFEKVGFLLKLYSPYLVICIFTGFICQQYFVVTGQENKYMYITTLGAVINITLNLFILKWLGSVGAVISTLISEIILMLIALHICRQDMIISFKKILIFSKNYIVASLCMGIVLMGLNCILSSGIAPFLVKVVCAGVTYLMILIFLKDTVILLVFNNIKNGVINIK